MHRRDTINTETPAAKPRIAVVLLCLCEDDGDKTAKPAPPSACALWPSGAAGEVALEDNGESKNGDRTLVHALLIISPQRSGLRENDDVSNLERVGVTGIGPVRLFPDTLKETRKDWLKGGSEP